MIMIVLSIAAIARRQLRRTSGILWVAFWAASAAAVLRPNITRTAAKAIGIGRGADLVMYCGLLATAIGFFLLYLRFRQLEANITKLVRHVAIQEAKETEEGSDAEKKHESSPNELNDNQ
jgi:hypothetical protein